MLVFGRPRSYTGAVALFHGSHRSHPADKALVKGLCSTPQLMAASTSARLMPAGALDEALLFATKARNEDGGGPVAVVPALNVLLVPVSGPGWRRGAPSGRAQGSRSAQTAFFKFTPPQLSIDRHFNSV